MIIYRWDITKVEVGEKRVGNVVSSDAARGNETTRLEKLSALNADVWLPVTPFCTGALS